MEAGRGGEWRQQTRGKRQRRRKGRKAKKEREERKVARATKETAGESRVTSAKAGTIGCGKTVGEGAPRIIAPEHGQTTAGENSGLRPLFRRHDGSLKRV
jgi:hypothetical protein